MLFLFAAMYTVGEHPFRLFVVMDTGLATEMRLMRSAGLERISPNVKRTKCEADQ
jgi:hypothetical protein